MDDGLINMAPPPRYSTISDSHMSTSSQGAESTPSANSVLSESSLVLQSGEILPTSTRDHDDEEAGAASGVSSLRQASGTRGKSSSETVSQRYFKGKSETISTDDYQSDEPENEAEWQARCIELEMALQKFRDQAHNIRKLLRDKVSQSHLFSSLRRGFVGQNIMFSERFP